MTTTLPAGQRVLDRFGLMRVELLDAARAERRVSRGVERRGKRRVLRGHRRQPADGGDVQIRRVRPIDRGRRAASRSQRRRSQRAVACRAIVRRRDMRWRSDRTSDQRRSRWSEKGSLMLVYHPPQCSYSRSRATPAARTARSLELGRARHRHHDRLRHLPIARRHRAEGAQPDADARALGRRRAHHAVRRALARRACRRAAGDRRLLRLPPRRLGPAVRRSASAGPSSC